MPLSSTLLSVWTIILLILGLLTMAALWRWTPLGKWLDIDTVTAALAWIKHHPLTPLLMPAAFVLGGLIAFPVTLMIITTVIIFGPWWGLFYALLGAELSALATFLLGRWLGRDMVERFAGSLLNRLNRHLSQSGITTVITFRIVPVAPFSIINIIAGVSAIRLRDFAIGSLLGLLPGTLAIVLVADQISASLRQPDLSSFTMLLSVIVLVAVALLGLRRWLRRKHPS